MNNFIGVWLIASGIIWLILGVFIFHGDAALSQVTGIFMVMLATIMVGVGAICRRK